MSSIDDPIVADIINSAEWNVNGVTVGKEGLRPRRYWRIFQCTICPYKLTTPHDYTRSEESMDSDTHSIIEHIKTHSKQPCGKCGESETNFLEHNRHYLMHHQKVTHECNECNSSFVEEQHRFDHCCVGLKCCLCEMNPCRCYLYEEHCNPDLNLCYCLNGDEEFMHTSCIEWEQRTYKNQCYPNITE